MAAFSAAQAQVPVAVISASPMSGCASLAVSFNDASSNNPTSWSWTFPGGSPTSSTAKNVAVLFNNPGVYTVTLVATNASGSSTPKQIQITVNPPPVADFNQDKTTGCFPTSVQFTNTSSPGAGATIISYAWDFGDGTQDTVQNPSHRYTGAGSFPVTLFVKNSFGCQGTAQVKNVQKAIVISGGVVPNFSSSLASSCALPVTASFTNSSTGPPNLTYLWDFGDGSPTSTIFAPTHPYTVAGNYTVKLAVTSSQGCSDTLPLKVNITASGNLTDFSAPDTVCVNSPVTFTNISSPPPNSSTWNYGDGSPVVTAKNGQYTYTSPGTYPVTLSNTFSGCNGSVTKNIYVVNPPVASFSGTNITSCKAPLTSSFTNTSTGSTSWTWDFGDGSSKSNAQTPLPHTYTTSGNFTVTLTANSATGCSSIQTLIVKIDKPTVTLTGFPAYGCAPYTFTPGAGTSSVDGIASYSWIFGNGNTSNSPTPPAQTYNSGVFETYLTVTTNGGCQATDSGTVKVGTIKPIPAFTFSPSSACVQAPVSFMDQTPAGTANQWMWQFGDGNTATVQNPNYSFLNPGTYNVTLTAYNNGCWDSISHAIVVSPPLAKFAFASVCGQKNNFNFTDGSTGPVTSWTWDFGDGSPNYVGQTPPTHVFPAGPPKTYTVTLTVTNGTCTNTASSPVNVNQSTTLVISNGASVCENSPINFTAIGPGNITNYEFVFGDGAFVNGGNPATSHIYTTPGIYQAKVITTDNKGCVDSSGTSAVTINGPVVKFSGPPVSGLSCGPLTVNFKDQTITTPPGNIKTWAWDFGDGGTSNVQNPSYAYTFQGTFIPKLTVTDNNGCTSSLDTSAPLIVSVMIPKFTTDDSNYCPASIIKFNNLSTGGYNPVYSWNFGDGSPLDNTFSPVHTYTNVGKYHDTLTMTDTYGCVQKFWNATPINIDTPSATFTMSANYSACPPLNVQFTFTGHYAQKYAWILGNGAISQLQNPTDLYSSPGDYYVTLTVQSPGGCSVTSDSQHIHIDGPIGSLTYTPLAGCDSLTVAFKVTTSNVSHFTWLFGDNTDSVSTTVDSIVHKYTVPGQYTPIVNLYDASGCKIPKIGTNFINVDSISNASFTADKNILCDSGIVTFTNTSQLANGTVISNYDWNFGDGSPDLTGAFPSTPHDYTSVGNDSVTMTITSAGGCTASARIPIVIAASPKIAINGLISQCAPAVLNFSGIEQVPDPYDPLTWTWNFGNGSAPVTGQTPAPVNYPKQGEYVVSLTATNTKGCSTMTDTTKPNHLFIYPIPEVNAGTDTTICLGNSLQLLATGDASTTFNWLPPTNGAVLSCLACNNPLANPVPGSTSFILHGTSPEGCAASDTINVTVNVPVTVTASGSDSVCLGQNTQLNATGAAIYDWSPAEGLSNPNVANPVATPDASQVGTGASNIITYTVVGYDSKKCFSDTASVQVTAFNYPIITLPTNATINVGNSYQINSTTSTNVVSLNWSPSNTLSCSNCLAPLATPIKTTTYSLTAINDGGCATTDSIRVQVICNGANFFVPNTFSPNGDGVNDHFIVNGVGLNVIPSITIYNRWGQIVFQKSNFAPNDASSAWDGTFNGQPAPSDVYIYTIQILCNNATLIPYHGNVTLIR
jgi:gliding motility-associated-like protein